MRNNALLPIILFATPVLARRAIKDSACFQSWSRLPVGTAKLQRFRGDKANARFHLSRNDVSSEELALLEQQVVASVKSRMDLERVLKALDTDVEASPRPRRNDLMYDDEDLTQTSTPQLQVAGAAAVVSTGISFWAFGNVLLSAFICFFVFVVANLDDDGLSGALARIVGRSAIHSVQASQPKIKAVARAVVTGDEETIALKTTIQQLRSENASLREWKEKRLKIEESLPRYSVAELRAMARHNGLPEGGTKTDLLKRLVDNYEIR
jgi:SAP domain